MFRDSAKVRFNCQRCGHGWTSMKGRVVFWFWLDPNDYQPLDCYGRAFHSGIVYFKLYGQKCQNCMDGKRFEAAMWYPEEVQKVRRPMFLKSPSSACQHVKFIPKSNSKLRVTG
ncbi:unnamed protein product [Dimorphilus gyrociliatus]|uniref:3CxxC-type domain-containing protein n=1 Tax=Dimorphilus gyrociliatus TaxID=2664684 RepID=A0A7I8W3K8_9ANNE|nr:unnamed protein product [Dimorphilus gyrociliatus]